MASLQRRLSLGASSDDWERVRKPYERLRGRLVNGQCEKIGEMVAEYVKLLLPSPQRSTPPPRVNSIDRACSPRSQRIVMSVCLLSIRFF